MAIGSDISRKAYTAIATGVFVVLGGAWCVVSYGRLVSPLFLPTPTAVAQAAVTLAQDHQLLGDVVSSNLRVIVGFALACVVAIPLGMLAGNVRVIEAALDPLIGFVRYLPVPAFIPLVMLYAGIDEGAKVLIIFLGAVVQMIVMAADVTKQTSSELVRASLALGASGGEVFRKVVWRSSLPGLVDLMRVNLGWAWTYLVVAELVAASQGLGFRILKAQRFLRVDIIFLYLMIIGLLGVGFDLAFKLAHRKLFPWAREKVRR